MSAIGKVCTKCGERKPLSEYHKRSSAKDGHRSHCKKCRRAYNAGRREEAKAYNSAYYKRHRDRLIAYQVAYKAEHGGRVRARNRAHHAEHREAHNAYCRAYYIERQEEARTRVAAYRKANRSKVNILHQHYRARKASADGRYTFEEWMDLVSQFDHCPCCGGDWDEVGPPTVDHIVPLSWPGARNGIEAIQPLCQPCNSRKGDRHDTDYIH